MENFGHIKYRILIFFIIIIFPSHVFSYSQNTTHPALTQETIKFFNLHYPFLALNSAEMDMVVKGSIEEDNSIRPMHHFYDPVYERGLTLALEWQSSKEWAIDTKNQAGILQKGTAGTINSLFSSGSDYSWERAIYDYVWEDKERGLEGLGHILHLIQDATVPDHTRNDPHPPAFEFGSPYESWTKNFSPENIDIVNDIINKRPIILNSLNNYFEKLSIYSNGNFFSEDTISLKEYSNPKILENNNGYLLHTNLDLEYEIAFVYREKKFDGNVLKTNEIFTLKDPNDLVLYNYWNLLSKQAVLYGAGVVKLFFDEVEKERESKELYKKNRSWFGRFYDNIEGKIFGVSKSLYGSSVDYEEDLEDPIERARSNQSASAIESSDNEISENRITAIVEFPETDSSEEDNLSEEDITKDSNEIIQKTTNDMEEKITDSDNDFVTEDNNDSKTDITESSDDNQNPVQIISGGGGGPSSAPEDSTAPDIPIITSPSDFASAFSTTTITFEGKAEDKSIISTDFSNDEAITNGNTWSMTLYNLKEGTTTITFYATDSSENVSIYGAKVDIGIKIPASADFVAPTFDSFSILQCDYSLSLSKCLSGSEEINLSWTSSSTDIAYYGLYKDDVLQSTTTSNSTTLSVSDGSSSSIKISVTDISGNSSTSTSKTVEVSTMPVVINEIAWAGTEASSGDEWIELYNRTSDSIDLSNIKLVASDGVPLLNLSGSIATGEYYLIERTDNDATSLTADLAIVFSGDGSGSGLSNSGESLSLIQALGGKASTTLDSTPASSACGGSWCAGTSDTNPSTMERINPNTDGSTASNWKSNNTYTKNGTDADGNDINGTPKSQNSVNIPGIGYYCPPETSTFVSGGYYIPTSGLCTYLSSEIGSVNKYGDIYRGVIASSTLKSGHSLGKSTTDVESGDDIDDGVQGEDFFTAIYETRSGPAFDDVDDFRAFFTTGANSPPHLNYGVIEWKYGVSP